MKENKDAQRLLYYFALVNFEMTMINGILPCSLMELEREINMTYTQQGMIGSLGYMGTALASQIAAPIIQKYGEHKTLSLALLLHAASTVLFTMSYHYGLLCFNRILQGFLQCFFVVFIPVWINKHSPPNRSTLWMGITQAAGPLGITCGYVLAGIFIYVLNNSINWRFSLIIQGIAEGLTFILILSIPGEAFELATDRKFHISQIKQILKNPLFMYVSLMLCSIFFVVTGIQYWSTSYLIKILLCNKRQVVFCFSIVSITAPICGVFMGSYLSDRYV